MADVMQRWHYRHNLSNEARWVDLSFTKIKIEVSEMLTELYGRGNWIYSSLMPGIQYERKHGVRKIALGL